MKKYNKPQIEKVAIFKKDTAGGWISKYRDIFGGKGKFISWF